MSGNLVGEKVANSCSAKVNWKSDKCAVYYLDV